MTPTVTPPWEPAQATRPATRTTTSEAAIDEALFLPAICCSSGTVFGARELESHGSRTRRASSGATRGQTRRHSVRSCVKYVRSAGAEVYSLVGSQLLHLTGEREMRKAAAALGLFGGWWGLIFAVVAATETRDFSTPTPWLPLVAIVMCVAGLVATALALSRPQPSWIIMGAAGVLLVVATLVSYTSYSDQSDLWRWLLPGILLIAGSALEFAVGRAR